jgi:hypothetical protein
MGYPSGKRGIVVDLGRIVKRRVAGRQGHRIEVEKSVEQRKILTDSDFGFTPEKLDEVVRTTLGASLIIFVARLPDIRYVWNLALLP